MVWETHKSEIGPLQKALPHIQKAEPGEDHATRSQRRRRADVVRSQLESVLHTASTEYVERVKNAVPTDGGNGSEVVAKEDSEQQRRKMAGESWSNAPFDDPTHPTTLSTIPLSAVSAAQLAHYPTTLSNGRPASDFQCRRELLHRCFLALGDLSRYRATLHISAGAEHASGAEGAAVAAAAERDAAERFYRQAWFLRTGSGTS